MLHLPKCIPWNNCYDTNYVHSHLLAIEEAPRERNMK